MLTREGCKARQQRLWSQLPEKPDWILISDPQHQMYFANYFQTPFIFRTTNAGALLILGRDGSSVLVADSMLRNSAEDCFADELVLPVWYNGKTSAPQRRSHLVRNALDRLAKCRGSRFGVEAAMVPVGIVEGLHAARTDLDLLDVDPVIHAMKRSKDPDEIALIRRSAKAGEAGFAAGLRDIAPGMTELQAYLVVQKASMEAAGEQALVYGDFVSGPRAEKGGGQPTDRVIARGDLVMLDFSVVLHGYRADFANTFACQSRATDRQREVYQACKDALAVGESMLAPGQACRDIDRAVRACFEGKHLGKFFHSHTGHGLGLGHPDPPYIVPDSADSLVVGDIVTLEPSQLVEGVGGMRIERNYLITPTGYETLTLHELTIDSVG